jgi:hypothetical protein
MLRSGNMVEVNRAEAQSRKAKVFNGKHDFYRNTRCTSTAQEEHSALPAGVINTHEDSDDDGCYQGEELELMKEDQELSVAAHWINQAGWDAAGEGRAVSPKTGQEINLRLDWGDVKKRLAECMSEKEKAQKIDEAAVLKKFDLETLDPTQRAFADRVLSWAAELVEVYNHRRTTGIAEAALLALWICRKRKVHHAQDDRSAHAALVPTRGRRRNRRSNSLHWRGGVQHRLRCQDSVFDLPHLSKCSLEE